MFKKLIAVLSILMMIFSLAGCSGDYEVTDGSKENFSLFRSTPLGFAMEFPDYWTHAVDKESEMVSFITPAEGYSDEYIDNVTVVRLKGEESFNDFAKTHRAQLEKELLNYKLVSEKKCTIGEEDGYQIVYESSDGKEDNPTQMRFMQIITKKGDYIYMISYIADFSSYSYFLTYFNTMIETFEFVE